MDKGDIEVWGHSSFTATGRGMMVTIWRLLTFTLTVKWFHCQFGIIWVAGPTGLYCIFLTMPCFFVCLSWVRQLNHQFPFVEIQLGWLPKELTSLVGQGRAGRAGPAGPV